MIKRKQFVILNEILDGIESLEFKVKTYKRLFQKEISVKLIKFNEVLKGVKLYDNRKSNRN